MIWPSNYGIKRMWWNTCVRFWKRGGSDEFAAALGHIAKARGMTEIAQASGIQREALYKALRSHSQPRFDTIQRVCRALGVQLTVKQDH